ncbi:MAG TPA: hypothetical protein EYH14_00665 [Euryarchaeota archaeon]|nr:hypothetical protein [Euryarchaeota archaeon]
MKRWDVPVLAVAVAAVVFVLLYTNTWAPYHLDSAGYIMRAVEFWEGNLEPSWRTGFALILAPFVPLYFLTGSYDVLHAVFVLLTFAGLFVIYNYLRSVSVPGALFALLLFISTPAAIYTINIGKDDVLLVGLAFLSLFLYRKFPLLSGIAAALCFTAKEPSVFLLAPLLLQIFPDLFSRERNYRRVFHFFLGVLILFPYVINQALWILTPQSPTIGKLDPSYLAYVLPHLLSGFGLAGATLFVFSLISLRSKESRRDVIPYLLLFLVSVAVLGSNSTTTYRTAIVPLSLLLFPAVVAFRSLQRYSLPLAALAVLIALASFSDAFPTIYFRGATNLPAHFSRSLSEYNAGYVLTMDFCGLYRYYADLNCITHPVYPEPSDYNAVLSEVSRHIPDGVLLSPDFFAYADDSFARWFLSAVELQPLGSEWFEDYHAVRPYPRLEDTGCTFRRTGSLKILSVTVDRGDLLCFSNGYPFVERALVFHDRLLYGVRNVPVYRVVRVVK